VLLAWDKNTLISKFATGEFEGVLIHEPYWEGTPPIPVSTEDTSSDIT
jgi:hypothetical protein